MGDPRTIHGAESADVPHHLLDQAVRDELASNPELTDSALFDAINQLFVEAEKALGPENVEVNALGLEATLFAGIPASTLAPRFTAPNVTALVAARMNSSSVRMRMAVASYLWEQGDSSGKRHGSTGARSALEWAGTLLAIKDDDPHRSHFHRGVRALGTAVALATASGQKQLLDDIVVLVVEQVTGASFTGDVSTVLFMEDLIVELRGRLSVAQRHEVVLSLRQLHQPALLDISPVSPPDFAGRLLQLRRQLAFADDNPATAHACDREHAALLAAHAGDRGDPLVEVMLLDHAITLAERGQDDVTTLNDYRTRRRDALARGIARMGQVRSQVALPADVAARTAEEHDRIATLPVQDFVTAFANCSRPRRAQLIEFGEQAMRNAPLTTMTPTLRITTTGETVAAGASQDDLIWKHGFQMHQVGAALHLVPIWSRRMDQGDIRAESLIGVLRQSGQFSEDNLELIALGLEDALRGAFIQSLHILVPQVEDVLRRLLRKSGHDSGHRNPSDFAASEEVSLGPILQRLQERSIFDGDEIFLFQLVLDEPRGLNLRNRIGHGLIRSTDCTLQTLVCVFQCYAIVAALSLSATSADG